MTRTPSVAGGRVVSKCSANNSGLLAQQETALQKRVAAFQLYLSYAALCPMILASMVLGPLSDVMGRRSLFLLPCTSAFLKQVIVLVAMRLDLPLWLFYVANVVDGMSGSFCTLLLAGFVYTADLTPPEKARTSGIAVVEFSLGLAGAGSKLAVGYVLQDLGFFYGTLGPTVFVGCGVLIGFFCLPETVPASIKAAHSGCVNPVKYIKNIFRFYLSEGSVRDRIRFWLSLITLSTIWITLLAQESVLTLYQLNLPFCWSPKQVGDFGAVSVAVRATMMVTAVHVLQRCLSDQAIAVAAIISLAGMLVMFALAHSDVMLYLALLVGCISDSAFPVNRSFMSKMAGANKQGALFASIAVTETLNTLISTTVYNSIYEATVAQMRGAVFLFMAGLLLVPFLLLLISARMSRTKQQTYEKIITSTSTDHKT